MDNKNDSENLYARWLNNELNEAEKDSFEQTEDFKLLSKIITEVDHWELPPISQNSYDSLKSQLPKGKVVNLARRRTFIAIAASIAILIGAFGIFSLLQSEKPTIASTKAGETKEVTLPDGSIVQLGGMTELSYNKESWSDSREVSLKGQGYFDVAKGSKFKVMLPLGEVEVLGTQFDIRARENILSVRCFEGKVKVTSAKAESILLPLHGIRWEGKDKLVPFEFLQSTPDWLEEYYKFDSTPILDVFDAVSSEYGVEIDCSNIDNHKLYTGVLIKDNLDKCLTVICTPLNLKYSIDGNKVVIE